MAWKNQSLNTGFGSNTQNEGNRLLNKDGTFNTEKRGLGFFQRFSLFHSLINMSWLSFFLVMLIGYIVINVVFALTYLLIGIEGITGASSSNGLQAFLDAFFFSSQTLTTVGYGAMSPASKSIGMISAFESFIGLLGFALATGLLYGRFSKPKAKLLFSEREFFFLPLEMDVISLLATSWTIVHPIDEKSPLYGLGEEDLKQNNIEIMLFLEGYDETYAQNVHSRSSYKGSEVLVNKKFKKILGKNKYGQATVEIDQLSSYENVQKS